MVDIEDLNSSGSNAVRVRVPPPAPKAMNILDKLHFKFSSNKPLIEVGISKTALLHNLHTYQNAFPDLQIAPVLKSNAYGHDLGLIARLLDKENIAFFMVDSLYEARRLRSAGAGSRIVVMGYVRPEEIAASRLSRVDFAITDIEQVRALLQITHTPIRVHLKIDTGMHRQGIPLSLLSETVALLKQNSNLIVAGVCSHFADADTANSTHTNLPLTHWKTALAHCMLEFPSIEYRHFGATKGMRFAKEANTNVARLGIGLYGFDTAPEHETTLEPVLELRSIIGELRLIPKGDSVGYNATYTASRETRVATVPAGYFEGIDRRLSNKGTVQVRGTACPIIGRVSMNMTTIDVTDVPHVSVGDSVTLISRNLEAPNSVQGIARSVSTDAYRESEYVVLVHIPQHLKRVLE